MHILICDDEKQYSEAIYASIQRWENNNPFSTVSVNVFTSSEDMLESLKNNSYDLAFLDIKFPGELNGLLVAQELRNSNEQMIIVFISNYEEYAIDGYKVNAFRFFYKPISDSQIFECLDIAARQLRLTMGSFLMLETKQQLFRIPYKSILYIESQAHYLTIHLINYDKSTIVIRRKLSDLNESLPQEMFVQCHQSFIVNLLFIQRISHYQVYLTNGAQFPISVKYRNSLYSRFKSFFQGDIV